MGEGVILEHGTHDELLQNKGGHYSRLVQAQNLRGSHSKSETTVDVGVEEPVAAERLGDASDLDAPLKSDALGQSPAVGENQSRNYSSIFLFRRMAQLNRESLPEYILGGLCAISGWDIFLSQCRPR